MSAAHANTRYFTQCWVIVCAICGRETRSFTASAERAEKNTRIDGWRKINGRWYCFKHADEFRTMGRFLSRAEREMGDM